MSRNLFFISILTAICLIISSPKNYPVHLQVFGHKLDFVLSSPEISITRPFIFSRDLNIKEGLDLRGGIEVLLSADMSGVGPSDRQDALDSAREVIARRVDLYGVSEPVIKTLIDGDNYRLSVALPGVDDEQSALELIGTTAKLDFRAPQASGGAEAVGFVSTGLTGKDLKKSSVQFDSNTGKPVVELIFTEEGGQKFADLTGRLVGKQLAIFLDDTPISAPTIQQQIVGGQAVISGDFTLEEAKNLAITLNAGALPVPIQILGQTNVSPTLGQESVRASLRAGGIGLASVGLFMILMYGGMGAVSVIGLVIYTLITLSLYKLIPITVTLPGLAGFILSIGMAVDSNILIFERTKEELRKGHLWREALELGFGRAWDSIKDANIATLITTFILFNPLDWPFLNTSGLVRGFALTLFLGVIISLFTGIFVTRNLLRAFIKNDK